MSVSEVVLYLCCTFRFAFIEYSSVEDATHALEKLNGTKIDGREINVTYATEKAPGSGHRFGSGRNSKCYISFHCMLQNPVVVEK